MSPGGEKNYGKVQAHYTQYVFVCFSFSVGFDV